MPQLLMDSCDRTVDRFEAELWTDLDDHAPVVLELVVH